MEALTLWPFSQCEIGDAQAPPVLIDCAFAGELGSLRPEPVTRAAVLDRATAGGYLPALERTGRRRAAWYDSDVAGVIDREVRAVTDAVYLTELPRLLRLVASLEAVFLVQTVPAWSTNLTSRVVRRPKVVLTDTGLAARLLGGRLTADAALAGRVIETFVGNELRAQAEWSASRPALFHFRDREGAEVDLVLETADGRVVGIEVTVGATVRADDPGGLRLMERRLGNDFAAGVVLCTAPEPRHLGGRLWTLPFSVLWS